MTGVKTAILILITSPLVRPSHHSALLESFRGNGASLLSRYCAWYGSIHGTLPATAGQAERLRLQDLTPLDACEGNESIGRKLQLITNQKDLLPILSSGNCSDVSQSLTVAQAGKEAGVNISIFLVMEEGAVDIPHVLPLYDNESSNMNYPVMVRLQRRQLLSMWAEGATHAKIYDPYMPDKIEVSGHVLIVSLATITIIFGSMWGGWERFENYKYHKQMNHLHKQKDVYQAAQQWRVVDVTNFVVWDNQLSFGWKQYLVCVIVMISVATGLLLLLAFYYDIFYYMIFIMVTIYGFICTCILLPAVVSFFYHDKGFPLPGLPSVKIKVTDLVTVLISAGLIVFYIMERDSRYGWLLQDIVAFFIVSVIIWSVQLPNLRIISILLIAFFIYDIVMVIITRELSTSHTSIMKIAATGIYSKTKRSLPLTYRIPKLGISDELYELNSICNSNAVNYIMLGLGDVILPGILLSFCRFCDLRLSLRFTSYYPWTLVAYVVGVALAIVVLDHTKQAQPALLYIVPLTLSVTSILAAYNGHIYLLYTGKRKTKKQSDHENAEIGKDTAETGEATPTS